MLFCLRNDERGIKTYSGVLEFVAEEGICYLPYWIMSRLLIEEGEFITITSATLQKGTFVRLQPHTTAFIDISNPRAVLEMAFRAYSTLTVGDTIKVEYNNRTYLIDVLEVKPENSFNSITIIEADLEVDFAPPLDYVEPVRPVPVVPVAAPAPEPEEQPVETPTFVPFVGKFHTLTGQPPKQLPRSPTAKPAPPPVSSVTAPKDVVFQTREQLKRGNSTPVSDPNKPKRRRRGETIESIPEAPKKNDFASFHGRGHSLR